MKNAIYYILITSSLIFTSSSNLLKDSLSYCDYLAQCRIISQLQEKLCLWNNKVTPYWLPSIDSNGQRCYLQLRNRYQMLDRLMHESNSLLLLCMAQRSKSLNNEQKDHCDESLSHVINRLRDENGRPVLTNCFQGGKRFLRQCGPLRQCCSAYDRCKERVKQSFITSQIKILLEKIQSAAKECEKGTYQSNSITGSINAEDIADDFSPNLITFRNDNDSDSLLEDFLRTPSNQWHKFLERVLIRETRNLSIFHRYNNIEPGQGFTADKNDNNYQTLPNNTADEKEQLIEKDFVTYPNEIEELNSTADIELDQGRKMNEDEYNGSYCDDYMKCRRQVEKSMDRCQILWNNVNRIPVLSTTTLLEMGNRCIDHDDHRFNEFYNLITERGSVLQRCLDNNKINESMTCSTNHTSLKRALINWDRLYNVTDSADCLAEVNFVQFKCAQLRKCCSNFHRCRNDTFDAKAELRIALLTAHLVTEYHDCLRHQLMIMIDS